MNEKATSVSSWVASSPEALSISEKDCFKVLRKKIGLADMRHVKIKEKE